MSDRPRVLHFIDSGGVYGAEHVILTLSREMKKGGGFEPVIGCITDSRSSTPDLSLIAATEGIESQVLRIRNLFVLFDLLIAAKTLRRLGIRIIHCHGYKPAVFGFFLSKVVGCELLATCHLWFIRRGDPLKMRFMIGIEKRLYPRYRFVVAVSEKIRQILLASGVAAERALLIRNGIEIDGVAGRRRRNGVMSWGMVSVAEDDLLLINAGRLTPQKGQSDFLAAVKQLISAGYPIKAIIAGEGELRDELQAEICHRDLAAYVTLLGFRNDIRELMEISDVFVLPSLDEGMPVALLEAVACELPVVATAVGDVCDLIEDRLTGWIVPTSSPQAIMEAICELVADQERSRKMAIGAKQRLEQKFTAKSMCLEYSEVYGKLVGFQGKEQVRRN